MSKAPSELGIDLMSGEFFGREPHDAFAWMREHEPVYYDEANDLFAITRYRHVKGVSTDVEAFSSAAGIRPKSPALPMMIDFDAPEHVRRRRLVSSGFTPRRVRDLERHIRAICDQIIDRVCEMGSCDFVRDIAAPLPLAVIGDMLGVAEDGRADLLRWSEDMLRSQGDSGPEVVELATQAFIEYSDYIHPVFDERRQSGNKDDLVGVLCHAEIEGDRLDDSSLVHETLLILIGGDETTRHVISGGMQALLENPAQWDKLRGDPGLLPVAVEEMLRWVSPIKNMARTATRDVELGGQVIKKGQEVLLIYPSANRDAEVFEAPDTFDVTRNPNPHMAFGFGAHFCLGNQLARIELRVMFEQLMARLPDIELIDDRPLPRRPANFITGLESMPVTFAPSAPLGASAP